MWNQTFGGYMNGMRKAAAVLLLLAVGVAGCSTDSPEDGEAPTTDEQTATDPGNGNGSEPEETTPEDDEPTSPPDEESEPEGAAEFGTTTQESASWPGGATEPVYLTGIRSAQHEGFQRLVFDHEGHPAPQYRVEYVDEARTEGTTDDIELEGSTILSVGVGAVMPPADLEAVHNELWTPEEGAGPVLEVRSTPIFEGHSTYFIALESEQEFRAFVLEEPSRLVVDIGE